MKYEKNDILAYLQSRKEFYRENYNIAKIGIFGSYSRGTQTENSDIDIIFEFDGVTTDIFHKKYQLREELSAYFHTNIDLCREKAIKPQFKAAILTEAIYV